MKKNYISYGENGYNDREYHFFIKDEIDIKDNIIFFHYKHIRRDNMNYIKDSDKKILEKKFLRKNKNIIIGIDFFTKYEICRIRDGIINRNRIIYLIDLTEKKNNKINMYEVIPAEICPWGE